LRLSICIELFGKVYTKLSYLLTFFSMPVEEANKPAVRITEESTIILSRF
jgi:hypothetical protein